MVSKRREFFDDQVEAYTDFAGGSFSWRYIELPAMDAHLSRLVNRNLFALDIGSGSGRIVRHLIELGVSPEKITGIDSSSKMVAEARRMSPDIKFVQGDVGSMTFTNNQFDLVTSNMVLHMMDDVELEKALGEIARVLKPGGIFFFIDTNPYQDPEDLHIKEWMEKNSPWGERIPVFQHDYKEITDVVTPSVGLKMVRLSYPIVLPEGVEANSSEYKRYTRKTFRICGMFEKVAPLSSGKIN